MIKTSPPSITAIKESATIARLAVMITNPAPRTPTMELPAKMSRKDAVQEKHASMAHVSMSIIQITYITHITSITPIPTPILSPTATISLSNRTQFLPGRL